MRRPPRRPSRRSTRRESTTARPTRRGSISPDGQGCARALGLARTLPPGSPMTLQPSETILIVDFGSQVTQLIARRVREAGVYSEIAPFSRALEACERLKPKGIILSGGPASVTLEDSPRADPSLFEAGVPMLGICYGQQLMAEQLGGRVVTGDHSEFGRAFIEIKESCALFDGLWNPGERHQVWMSHG